MNSWQHRVESEAFLPLGYCTVVVLLVFKPRASHCFLSAEEELCLTVPSPDLQCSSFSSGDLIRTRQKVGVQEKPSLPRN